MKHSHVPLSVHRKWDYYHPTRVVFGDGTFAQLPQRCRGDRVLVVMSPGSAERGLSEAVTSALGTRLACLVATVSPNPDVYELIATAESLSDSNVTEIVAIGGGSVIDTGKFLSAALPEGVVPGMLGQDLKKGRATAISEALPLLAVPTTAGTGSEVTPFATVWDRQANRKMSLASPRLSPHTAILDPSLTLSVPREATLSTGLDALSQGLESLWNKNWNAISAACATRTVVLAMRHLPELANDLNDVPARRGMLEASMLSGLAISHTRTALAHSMSYPITAHLGLPHGLACAFTLPSLFEFNWPVDVGGLRGMLTNFDSKPEQFVALLESLLHDCSMVDYLSKYGVSLESTLPLTGEMLTPGRSDNNAREASSDDIQSLIRDAFARLA